MWGSPQLLRLALVDGGTLLEMARGRFRVHPYHHPKRSPITSLGVAVLKNGTTHPTATLAVKTVLPTRQATLAVLLVLFLIAPHQLTQEGAIKEPGP